MNKNTEQENVTGKPNETPFFARLRNKFRREATPQKRERVKRGVTKPLPNEKKSKTLRKMQAKSRKINRGGK